MHLTFQVPMQYCSLQRQTITSHIHNWALFSLWLCLFILSGAISLLFSSSTLGTYWPGEFIFQCHTFLPFHTVHGFSRQEYWSGLPFLSLVGHFLSELSAMTHLSWVALHGMAHSFIELDEFIHVSKHHVVHLKSLQFYLVSHTSIKQEGNNIYHSLLFNTGIMWSCKWNPQSQICHFLRWVPWETNGSLTWWKVPGSIQSCCCCGKEKLMFDPCQTFMMYFKHV